MLNYKTNVFLAEDKKPDSEGKVPVRFYVNVSGERITKHVGIRVRPRDWNSEKWQVRKSDSNYRNHNETIRTTISEVEAKIQEAYNQRKKITPALVRNILRGKTGNDDFYRFAESLSVDLEKKHTTSTIQLYDQAIIRLKKFQAQIYFNDVDALWLRKYESHLRDAGFAQNTLNKHFKFMKKVFNAAIREGVTDNYPFKNYDCPKYIQTDRTFLLIEEVDLIEQLLRQPLDECFAVTANYFLLGCYSGLRYSEWNRFNYEEFIRGDRMIFRAKKNKAAVTILMHDKLKAVVERLRNLPPIYTEQKTNFYLKSIALLAGISKKLTTHVARHTFATNCLRLKYPDNYIAQAMGITKETLEVYKHLINPELDNEMLKWNEQARQMQGIRQGS